VNDTAGFVPFSTKFTVGEDVPPAGDVDTYLWNFGDGGNSTVQYPTHVFTVNGTYNVQINVTRTNTATNASAWSITGVKVVVGQNAQKVFITAPINGTKYNAGDTISFSGFATDSNGNTIPTTSLSWTVIFHHLTHIHPGPITDLAVDSGNFIIPRISD